MSSSPVSERQKKRAANTRTGDPNLDRLIENNKAWVDETQREHPELFEEMAKGQEPHYLYIGCSDSRADPAKLMGLDMGEIFVHRNVGNLCTNDLNFLSVLEYAVSFLKVPHIIVCGHYDCGAVRNSCKKQDIGLLENWLRNIRDVHRIHAKALSEISDDEAKHRRLVELNVVEQCLNIFKTACVQRRRHTPNPDEPFVTPRIHAFVFDPATGLLKKLDINFKEETEKYQHIYDLY